MTKEAPSSTGAAGRGDGVRDDGERDGPSFVASADQVYFRAVEELFVGLRGAPMLLSPVDWQVASSWRRRGIPLTTVRDALEGVFAKRRERGATRRVNSLRYCAPAVDKAWGAVLELGRVAEAGAALPAAAAPTVPGLLERLAASLPALLPGVETWRERVRALRGDAEEVERQLAALDAELLLGLEAALPAAERSALQDAARAAAARLAERLGPAEVERAARRLGDLRLREHWGAPALSLFGVVGTARTASPGGEQNAAPGVGDAEPG